MAKKSFKKAIDDKTKLGEKSGVSAVFSSTIKGEREEQKTENASLSSSAPPSLNEEPKSIRQSFVIQDDYLDKLKDFVHFKKHTENPYYTQKEALQEALDLLFQTVNQIPERPRAVKLAEQKRSGKIKKGRK